MVIFQWRCVKLRGSTPRNGRLQQGDLIPKCPNINQLLVVFSSGSPPPPSTSTWYHLIIAITFTSSSRSISVTITIILPSSYYLPHTSHPPHKKEKKHHCHHPKKRKLPKISLPNHKSPTSLCVLFGPRILKSCWPPGGPLHLASNSTLKRLFATEHAERRRRR